MKNDMASKIDNVVKFEELTSEELQQISGGIVPVMFAAGAAASFVAGYVFSRK